MTAYERAASLGVDPRAYWIDPAGGVRQYSADRRASLDRAIRADGSTASGTGESWATRAGIYLRAAGERWRIWRMVDPTFDPSETLSVTADGQIVEREPGMNPWLLGALVLSAPLAAIVLPGVMAGAGAGAAGTAGSSAAAAAGGVSSTVGAAVSVGSSIALGVYQQQQQNARAEQQAEIQRQAAIAAQAQGGFLGGLDPTTILICGAIVVVAVFVRR